MQLWGPVTLLVDLWLKWSLKQSCSPPWKNFNNMLHTTCTQRNLVDSWLLIVRYQIADLTPSLSFGHKLRFKCPNGSCKPILDICIPKYFQWYKELLKLLSFDPCNGLLKIRESIGTPSPKVWVALRGWRFIPSHFLTLPWTCGVTLELPLGSQPYKPLCLGHEPKARVATLKVHPKVLVNSGGQHWKSWPRSRTIIA
jgi:hypothetical protein